MIEDLNAIRRAISWENKREGVFGVRADFSEDPTFGWINDLSRDVKSAIKQSKILVSMEVGTSVFFDPRPKGKSLSTGTLEEQMAFSELLTMSDVVLLTSDEAESLTGIGNPILAGQELLKRGSRTK
ncbi:Oxidoreductase NAD-binding domain-containing protein 1 [Bienertia sinuspersici]